MYHFFELIGGFLAVIGAYATHKSVKTAIDKGRLYGEKTLVSSWLITGVILIVVSIVLRYYLL